MTDDQTTGWYISDSHATRAVGYMGAAMVEKQWLVPDFIQPLLLALWGEALAATMQLDDLSPVDERMVKESA